MPCNDPSSFPIWVTQGPKRQSTQAGSGVQEQRQERAASRAIPSNQSSTSTYRLSRTEKYLESGYLPSNVPASRGPKQKTYLQCRVLHGSLDSTKQNIFHVEVLASSLAAWFLMRKHLFHKGKTCSDLTEIFSKAHFI